MNSMKKNSLTSMVYEILSHTLSTQESLYSTIYGFLTLEMSSICTMKKLIINQKCMQQGKLNLIHWSACHLDKRNSRWKNLCSLLEVFHHIPYDHENLHEQPFLRSVSPHPIQPETFKSEVVDNWITYSQNIICTYIQQKETSEIIQKDFENIITK